MVQPHRNIAGEYEEFAYIVSHDLQAPVRHAREFTRLLTKSIGTELDKNQKTYIDFIEKSFSRLDRMHEALLAFSRITTRGNAFKPVDSNAVLKDVLQNMTDKLEKSGASLVYDNLPPVCADPEQAGMIFYYLIENALKYHHEDAGEKHVRISSRTEGRFVVFEIEDNGIGIEKQFQDDIFKMFRRLHTQDQFGGGTGAGLALAKKIVERHGGFISVESEPEHGAQFIFSFPKAE
jgi:light-regulated signal transduction histidine kinase (bacteriophytochrome)